MSKRSTDKYEQAEASEKDTAANREQWKRSVITDEQFERQNYSDMDMMNASLAAEQEEQDAEGGRS